MENQEIVALIEEVKELKNELKKATVLITKAILCVANADSAFDDKICLDDLTV